MLKYNDILTKIYLRMQLFIKNNKQRKWYTRNFYITICNVTGLQKYVCNINIRKIKNIFGCDDQSVSLRQRCGLR